MQSNDKKIKLDTPDRRKKALSWVTELFRRYLQGEATDKERKAVEFWKPTLEEKKTLNEKELEKDCDTKAIWQSISNHLGFDPIAEDPAIGITRKRKKLPIEFIYRYAAVVLIALLIGGGLYYSVHHHEDSLFAYTSEKSNVVYETLSETNRIVLADGTTINMNKNTRLYIIPEEFNKAKREIWMEEGEAFFDVASNPQRPFIIHNGKLQTTVKGTSFNIKAYKELEINTISVHTGKVEVSLDNKVLETLTPNKQIVYHTINHEFEIQDADWEDAAAWIENRLVLRNANVGEFKLRLQQYYGVNLNIENNALAEAQLINSSFVKGTSLEEVLESISILYDVKYTINSPQRVTIYKE